MKKWDGLIQLLGQKSPQGIYSKNTKNLITRKFVVINLKFEQGGFTIEKCVQNIYME